MALSPTDVLKLDDLLLIQFQRLAFDDSAEWLLSYYPMIARVETDPYLFVRSMQLTLPHLQVAYPVTNTADCTMQAHYVDGETTIVENEFGIPEPVGSEAIDPSEIDVVFVPLLAFDQQGYRVGYGKGFYDRFLAQCRENVIAIGFSYFDPVPKIDDANQFDIPLNYCVTPQQLYEF